jgi:hypothetical protein
MIEIDKDSKVLKILNNIKNRPFPDLPTMVEESLILMEENKYPAANSKSLIKARALLSNSRSKLVFKRLEILQELSILNGAKEDLQNYIYSKYANYLSSYLKNQKNREAIINRAVAPLNKNIRKLNSALEVVNQIIADFDNRAFSIKDTILCLQLGEREG